MKSLKVSNTKAPLVILLAMTISCGLGYLVGYYIIAPFF